MQGSGLLQWDDGLQLEEISVGSLNGKQIFKKELAPTANNVKLPHLAKGMYILGIKRMGSVSYRKFINASNHKKQALLSFETTQNIHTGIRSQTRSSSPDSLTIKVQHDSYSALLSLKSFTKTTTIFL